MPNLLDRDSLLRIPTQAEIDLCRFKALAAGFTEFDCLTDEAKAALSVRAQAIAGDEETIVDDDVDVETDDGGPDTEFAEDDGDDDDDDEFEDEDDEEDDDI